MNRLIKKNLYERIKLYELVRILDRALSTLQHNKSKDDFDSILGTIIPVTHLKSYEAQAISHYTKSIFGMIREELWDEGKLIHKECIERQGLNVYRFTMFQKLREEWIVTFEPIALEIKCSCKGMESGGIPCCHAFIVMKAENLQELPLPMVLKRWSKGAKDNKTSSHTLQNLHALQQDSKSCCPFNYMQQTMLHCKHR